MSGMLGLFGGEPGRITNELLDDLVEDGLLEWALIDGEKKYRLTEAGERYVIDELFPSLGVTHEEAMAWMGEHFARPDQLIRDSIDGDDPRGGP